MKQQIKQKQTNLWGLKHTTNLEIVNSSQYYASWRSPISLPNILIDQKSKLDSNKYKKIKKLVFQTRGQLKKLRNQFKDS